MSSVGLKCTRCLDLARVLYVCSDGAVLLHTAVHSDSCSMSNTASRGTAYCIIYYMYNIASSIAAGRGNRWRPGRDNASPPAGMGLGGAPPTSVSPAAAAMGTGRRLPPFSVLTEESRRRLVASVREGSPLATSLASDYLQSLTEERRGGSEHAQPEKEQGGSRPETAAGRRWWGAAATPPQGSELRGGGGPSADLVQRASRGVPEALNELGCRLDAGEGGVQHDRQQAMALLRAAADQGHADAANNLAEIL
jgi:TPR repeat protein